MIQTTARQRKILRSLARNKARELNSKITPDEEYLRKHNLIRYRGKRAPNEPDIGWYITDPGREYLNNYKYSRQGQAIEWLKWGIGIILAIVGIFVGLGTSTNSPPSVIKTDAENAPKNGVEDIEPYESVTPVTVTTEPVENTHK